MKKKVSITQAIIFLNELFRQEREDGVVFDVDYDDVNGKAIFTIHPEIMHPWPEFKDLGDT